MNWDKKWSAVSALVAIAGGIIIPILLFVLGRDTKGLTVETVSSTTLIDLSNPELASLRLTYKDVSVSRLSVATIEVRNSGNRPIERGDFEAPIVLRVKNPLDVLAVTINEKDPHDLKPLIDSDDSGISIAPLLLNPGDHFRITLQLRGDFNEPEVDARISGVPTILRRMFRPEDPTQVGIVLMASAIATFFVYTYIAAFLSTTLLRRLPYTVLPVPDNIAAVMGLALGTSALYVAGAKALQLSDVQTLSWAAVGILPTILAFIFASRRSLRLWKTLKQRTNEAL